MESFKKNHFPKIYLNINIGQFKERKFSKIKPPIAMKKLPIFMESFLL